jgi:transketolase
LADADSNAPRAILLGSGSEVSVALVAHQKLAEAGISTRVVSMPSWELFDVQPAKYQTTVLPPDVPRLTIEAGVTLAWARYAGERGKTIGLDRFGASAPYKILYEQFGITVENVIKQVQDLVQ